MKTHHREGEGDAGENRAEGNCHVVVVVDPDKYAFVVVVVVGQLWSQSKGEQGKWMKKFVAGHSEKGHLPLPSHEVALGCHTASG